MTTLEKRETEASEKWKESYSPSGVRLLESAVEHARKLERSFLQLKDIALVLTKEEKIQDILRKLRLHPVPIQASLESRLNRPIEEDFWSGSVHNISIENMIFAAKKESEDGSSSKIRAGDIMVAILESPTTSGKALKEAFVPGKEKGISFLPQLRHVINQVEAPWEA